jgi:hypothetical protein
MISADLEQTATSATPVDAGIANRTAKPEHNAASLAKVVSGIVDSFPFFECTLGTWRLGGFIGMALARRDDANRSSNEVRIPLDVGH